ncbi:MAG: HutD/Ves family protein [Pseudomarimonas sp.]
MKLRYLPSYEFQRMRWRNQLGWTREIAREPHPSGVGDAWRVSIAEIDHDSAYSEFPGRNREQVLLEGNGFVLTFPDGSETRLEPPHGRIAFDGRLAPQCRLIDGPVRDFNLFYDPSLLTATLHHRPLVGTMLVFVEPTSTWLIYAMAGQFTLRGDDSRLPVLQGDCLRADNPANGRQRLLLEGGGELLLVSISPLVAP